MKMNKYKMAVVGGGALALAGCSTMKADSTIAIEPNRKVMITNVSVRQSDGVVEVEGKLRPKSATVRQAGHVDIAFLGEDGEVLKEMKSQPNVSTFSRKSSRKPSFEASAKLDPSEYAKVRVTPHAGSEKACPR